MLCQLMRIASGWIYANARCCTIVWIGSTLLSSTINNSQRIRFQHVMPPVYTCEFIQVRHNTILYHVFFYYLLYARLE